MNISGLRARVEAARRHERSDTVVRDWLSHRSPDLHRAIVSAVAPDTDPIEALLTFIDAYIGHVPDMLEAADAVAEAARIREQLLPVLKVAEAFFLQPPDLPADHQGMLALLDEAYLAHRLVEEVNDRYVGHGCGPLIPLDNTRANLIVHQLLGEPFSNELDAIVAEALKGLVPESLFEGSAFREYQEKVDPESCRLLWQQWSCMSQTLGMEIKWRAAT
jgi:hypothetical protein